MNSDHADRNNGAESAVLLSHADYWFDDHERSVAPTSEITGHRTTFRSYDIDPCQIQRRKKFDRIWKYQVGRGQTWEDDSWQKQVVWKDDMWKKCDAVLQYCEVPELERKVALRRTLSESLQGFSRHYDGAVGACVGFALLEMFESVERARDSWVVERFTGVPGFDRETAENLAEYVFGKYGNEVVRQ